MASFTAVTVGNNTLATDINQYANALNGTTSAGVIVSGGASSFVPYTGSITAAPASGDSVLFSSIVAADTVTRAGASIRSDGYGMFKVGSGASVAANWYGISSGWKTDQSVTIATNLTVAGSSSLDNATLTTNGTGILSWNRTLSAGNKLADFQQGYGLWSDNVGAFGGTTRLWFDVPSGAEMHFGGRAGAPITTARFIIQAMMLDAQSSIAWPYIDGRNGTGGNGFRCVGSGTVIARFQTGSTGLIINNGYQFGSGGADQAELFWSEDETLGPGDVVRVVEDETYGGLIARCDRDNYPAAFILSTAPASVHGGQLIDVVEGDKIIQEPDPDPRWKPVAMDGRVPVKVTGDLGQYRPGETFLVSTADGRARPAAEGERPRWLCVNTKTDVGKRPLAPGCVLALLL